ncbi:MAG: aminotransferase class I/II-fold pyridoxal phosphate-dependent enzyme [Saccharofermentanales bacterium]
MTDIPLDRTPIIKMLSECLGNDKVSYHMPGHNHGTEFSEWLHRHALMIDTTEFALTDDLHHPGKPIGSALELARQAFGAGRSFFVTTGATIAVHSAIYALTRPGDLIIASRCSHKSLINACRMFGLSVVFTGNEDIQEALDRYPEAVLVFITRPDYYGAALDIGPVSQAVHDHHKVLVVDEAHGTHFSFAPEIMPIGALAGGGDIVIQSAHKTTPALTQGAYLHLSVDALESGRISAVAIDDSLSALTTSSPSFLIAATLDYSRAYLEMFGHSRSMELYDAILYFYSILNPGWLACIPNSMSLHTTNGLDLDMRGTFNVDAAADQGYRRIDADPFRIAISPLKVGITPAELSQEMADHGIYAEFMDLTRVVLLCKFGNTRDDFKLLAKVLNGLYDKAVVSADTCIRVSDDSFEAADELQHRLDRIYNTSSSKITEFHGIRLHRNDNEPVFLELSAGRISAVDCIPYPPGIPLVFAGESIAPESIGIILACLHAGLTVNGVDLIMSDSIGDAIPSIRCFR